MEKPMKNITNFFGFCTEIRVYQGFLNVAAFFVLNDANWREGFFVTIEKWRVTGIPTNKDEWASLWSWLVGGGSPLYVLFFNVN